MNSDYPIHLWNHFINDWPRTNNQVEWDNNKNLKFHLKIWTYENIKFIRFQKQKCSSIISAGNIIQIFTQNAVPSIFSVMQKIQILKSNIVNRLNQTLPDLNQQLIIIKTFIIAMAHLYQYEEAKKWKWRLYLKIANFPQVQIPQLINQFTISSFGINLLADLKTLL